MGQLSLGIKQAGREAVQSSAHSSKDLKAWRYTSTTLMPAYTAAILPFFYFLFIIISRKKKRLFFYCYCGGPCSIRPVHVGFVVDKVALG
jgi:hypothetical protein